MTGFNVIFFGFFVFFDFVCVHIFVIAFFGQFFYEDFLSCRGMCMEYD